MKNLVRALIKIAPIYNMGNLYNQYALDCQRDFFIKGYVPEGIDKPIKFI